MSDNDFVFIVNIASCVIPLSAVTAQCIVQLHFALTAHQGLMRISCLRQRLVASFKASTLVSLRGAH